MKERILNIAKSKIRSHEREGFEVASTFRTEDNKLYVIFRRKPINNNEWTR